MTLPIRRSVAARPRRPVIRSATGISGTRVAAALVLMMGAGGMYGLTTAEAFDLDPRTVTMDGLHYTDAAAALRAMGLADGGTPNLFRIRTTDLARALEELPAVRSASVDTELPDALHVNVVERVPIIAWRYPAATRLVDVEGADLAPATGDEGLPIVEDLRAAGVPVTPGTAIARLDLEVARLLGAVNPSDLGSTAASLSVSVTDTEGWILEAVGGWRAVFGHYTPTLRPPSAIATQVACLAGVLRHEGEEGVGTVTLAPSGDGCGTYRPAGSPGPVPSVSPDASVAPGVPPPPRSPRPSRSPRG